MIGHLEQMLATNQFLAGGAVLGIISGLVFWLKSLPARVYGWVRRQVFISVTIEDRDEAFGWVERWLANQPYGVRRARSLIAISGRRDKQPQENSLSIGLICKPPFHEKLPEIVFTPNRGVHYFVYRGKLVILSRGKDPTSSGPDSGIMRMLIPESITLEVLTRDRGVIRRLLEDARALSYPPDELRTKVYSAWYREWRLAVKRRARPLDSVIMKAGIMESVLATIQTFLTSERWYVEHGVPYRLGIELYGPPGSGKSSLVAALASHFQMDIAVLDLAADNLDDAGLNVLLSTVPPGSFLLIEDIDCIFNGRERAGEAHNNLTFSGLLNAIDGVAAAEGRVMFLTSNRHDVLDAALVRPGRVDVRFEIGVADADQIMRMYRRFHPHATVRESRAFADSVGANTSMAAVQQLLMDEAKWLNEPPRLQLLSSRGLKQQ